MGLLDAIGMHDIHPGMRVSGTRVPVSSRAYPQSVPVVPECGRLLRHAQTLSTKVSLRCSGINIRAMLIERALLLGLCSASGRCSA